MALGLTPLLPSIESVTATDLSMAAEPVWHAANVDNDRANPWDMCHALIDRGLGVSGRATTVDFAEPDVEHTWLWSSEASQALAISGQCGPPEPQDGDVYAVHSSDTWFREGAFSQLDDARTKIGTPPDSERVRIAHLDTGYDPRHESTPRHLAPEAEQRDFTVDPPRTDARDPGTGGVNANPGHGTATLALLAGQFVDQHGQRTPLGGADALEVLPLRVAKGVVLFMTSAIARAFDYVHSLADDPARRVDVVSMSMGGLASAAWADAVNALYDRGIIVVTAAGNNYGNLPTRYIVYPARFNRVIAACGVMADGRPYADLPIRKMAGCYGPRRKEATALSGFTPNVPWARIGCPGLFDRDGGGTSSATPQIAAAAALWVQTHRDALARSYGSGDAWARVEAARKALFGAARFPGKDRDTRHLGQGTLRARAALDIPPARIEDLTPQKRDSASFPLIRVLTGLGVAARGESAWRMLELEALQITQRSSDIEALLGEGDPSDPDLGGEAAEVDARRLLEAIADHGAASQALRSTIAQGLRRLGGGGPPLPPAPADAPATTPDAGQVEEPSPPSGSSPANRPYQALAPTHRHLRVFAFDPLMGTRLDTLDLNVATLAIPWEADLRPGPVGEYVEVVDVDPPSEWVYRPVDLNQPEILAQDGLAPSEGLPQFHQQMTYAVAMRTVATFEDALGRRALWAEREPREGGRFEFVRRLRLYPHALSEANAFYDPARRAILFGYFRTGASDPGDNLPGGTIFTCLSHDIVTHEVCHALLDGVHPYYKEPTNIDMLAFHEAFADIVALFQHFTMPEPLRFEIGRARGDLRAADLLAGLAQQFGQGIGRRGMLRSAISRPTADGRWERIQPRKTDYAAHTEPHRRGAVLVAAVFDAFLQIYEHRTRDLLRLATGGTGVMPAGAIPPDLVERLAREAAESARQVLRICVRALDYCPPVDLGFGEFLRALVTADRDVAPNDDQLCRVAFVAAFRARGIYPPDVPNLSVDTLAWQRPEDFIGQVPDLFEGISVDWSLRADRKCAYLSANAAARALTRRLGVLMGDNDEQALRVLGVVLTDTKGDAVRTLDGVKGTVSKPRVLSVRPLRRLRADGQCLNHIVVEITQRWKPETSDVFHRGGCSIVYDADAQQILYIVRKRVGNRWRANQEQAFRQAFAVEPYVSDASRDSQPFAMIHRGH